jgi:hypothetical protein
MNTPLNRLAITGAFVVEDMMVQLLSGYHVRDIGLGRRRSTAEHLSDVTCLNCVECSSDVKCAASVKQRPVKVLL